MRFVFSLTLVLAVALPGSALAQAGRFLMAVGDVVVSRGAQQIPAAAGTPVEQGDTIRLGANSNAQVRFSDEAIVALRQNTVFRIEEYVYSGAVDGSEKTVLNLVRGGLRTITGAIGRLHTRDKYRVRTSTATIGIRGTHYVVVHCDNDCGEAEKITVAGLELAQAGGIGGGAASGQNGTFGGVSDGRIDVSNNGARSTTVEFGANEFFRVASADTPPQGLIAPPGFLYDRLSGRARRAGNAGNETPPSGGANNESRSNELPPLLTPVGPIVITQPLTDPVATERPEIGLVGSWHGADGARTDGAAAVTRAMLTGLSGSGTSQTLSAFNIPGANTTGDISDVNVVGANLASVTQQGGADPGDGSINANWGVWNSGTITDDVGVNTFPGGAHYMFGNIAPGEVIAAKTGTFAMSQIGGTNPTSNVLGPFSAGSYPSLTINFAARTVSAGAFSWGFSGGSMSMGPATGTVFIHNNAGFVDISGGPVTCSGGPCGGSTPGSYAMSGVFLGPKGDHLGTAWAAQGASATAHGVRLYTCAPTC